MNDRPQRSRTLAHALLAAGALAWLAAAAVRAQAQEGAETRWTLTSAVDHALAGYPSLAASRARVTAAREGVGEARADHGPLIAATIGAAEYQDPVPVTPIHGFGPGTAPAFDDTLVQGGVQASYTLFDAGVRHQKVLQAEAELAASGSALTAAEQAVAARVATAYSEVLARRQTAAAQQARVSAVRAEVDRVGQLLAVGKAPEVDRLRAEAALASAEAEATRADTELDSAERDLARLIGVEVDAVRADRLTPLRQPTAATSDLPDRIQLQQRAIESSPEVARGRSALAGAEATRALARTAYFPKLKTTGAYQELGASELSFSSEWNVALQLAVPLWDGGVTDRRVARATAGVDDARARLAQAELDARAAVDGALASLTDAQARSQALTKAAQRLTEVARIQKLLLEVGSGTQIDYLAAEAEVATTRATLAETASAALVSRVRLALATGDLSIDWLARNLEATPNPSNPLPSSQPENFR